MSPTFEVAVKKANKLISKKKEALLINHINSALSVIHEVEYYKILNYLKDKGINLSCIDTESPSSNDKVKVYYVKEGVLVGDHAHEFNESYICLFGKMEIKVNNTTNIINSFETFKVNKYQTHSVKFIDDTFLVVFAQ
jgi:hypothetical protein